MFDYKSAEPGLGKGGTGVLSVDGKEVARKSMEHTTPITFPEDETFDVGQDTRTPLALLEYRYDVPFKFTGKIDRLTFELGPDLSAEKEAADCWADENRRLRRKMKKALVFAAAAETLTGLALAVAPSLVGWLLLGQELAGVAAAVARVAGIALIGLGVACWPGPPILGMLIYSASVAFYLGYLGATGAATGFLLWPAVAVHVVLTALLPRAALNRRSP